MDSGNGYGKDMGVLWASYKNGGFSELPENLEQEDFAEVIVKWLRRFQAVLIVEDRTSAFSKKRGPVAVITIVNDGEVIKPFAAFFSWASKRNILRTIVGFLQYAKYSSEISLCVIYGVDSEYKLFSRQRRYGHKLWNVGNNVWCLSGRRKNPRE